MKLSKECFKCGENKPLSAFYKHKQMKDGHVNKCKTCNLVDVSEHRLANLEKIREYDRERGARTRSGYCKEYRAKFPNKYKAHRMVSGAIKSGKLHKEPCVVCGTIENIVGHHNDYLKPLNVVWMCQAHHKQWHVKNGEGLNG
tara:strand:+ start:61 stop:489 length:429 start_codon:yes stop_codon:yes gene_type:complete